VPDAPSAHLSLDFHGPLSEARAGRLVDRLARNAPRTVLDIGCGWGELLLRLVAACPAATGVGVDVNADDLTRGRRNAADRGLDDRVQFLEESATGRAYGAADVVLCLGAGHALSDAEPPDHIGAALRRLRSMVAPGGRVVLGEGFWQQVPTTDQLAAMWPDARADEYPDLAGLVDTAIGAGFRPVWIETASPSEWEEFESGYQAGLEEWLAGAGDHPAAAEVRERVDRHRAAWLRGYRNVLGLAYLTLAPTR
jgi:SAM-dependent methyltransferase